MKILIPLFLVLHTVTGAVTPPELAQRTGHGTKRLYELDQMSLAADSSSQYSHPARWELFANVQGGASETNTSKPSDADSWTSSVGGILHLYTPGAPDAFALEQNQLSRKITQARQDQERIEELREQRLWIIEYLSEHDQTRIRARHKERIDDLTQLLRQRTEARLSPIASTARVTNASADAMLRLQESEARMQQARLGLGRWLQATEELQADWNFLPCITTHMDSLSTTRHPQARQFPGTDGSEGPQSPSWWRNFALDAKVWHTTAWSDPQPESIDAGIGMGLFANLPVGGNDRGTPKIKRQIRREQNQQRLQQETLRLRRAWESSLLSYRSAEQKLRNAQQALAVQYSISAGDSNRFLNAGFGDIETMLLVYNDLLGREITVLESRKQLAIAKAHALYYHESPSENCTENAPANMATYAWQGGRWLAHPDSLLLILRRLSVNRLALSLGPRELQDGFPTQAWQRTSRLLQESGIRTELLLGDPGWLLPAQRSRLMDLLQNAARAGVLSVHLDLEPDQLDSPAGSSIRDSAMTYLEETLRAARSIFPPPLRLSASLHHRYFSDPTWSPSAERIDRLQLDEIVLMAYVANMDRMHSILKSALRQPRKTPIAMAASVEASLPAENRLAVPPAHAAAALQASAPTLLYIQSLEDWIRATEVVP